MQHSTSPSLLREGSWFDGLVYLSLCRRNARLRSQRRCSRRGTWPGWCAVHRSLHSDLRHCCLGRGETFKLMKTMNRSYSTIWWPVMNLQEVANVFTWILRWVAGPPTCWVSKGHQGGRFFSQTTVRSTVISCFRPQSATVLTTLSADTVNIQPVAANCLTCSRKLVAIEQPGDLFESRPAVSLQHLQGEHQSQSSHTQPSGIQLLIPPARWVCSSAGRRRRWRCRPCPEARGGRTLRLTLAPAHEDTEWISSRNVSETVWN